MRSGINACDPNLFAMSDKKHIFDKKKNIMVLLLVFFSSCVFFFFLDLIFYAGLADKHAVFEWEDWIGFYPVFGFVGCVILVLVSKYILRPIVMRDEDHHDD